MTVTTTAAQEAVERICRLTPLQNGMFFEALRKQGSGEVIYQVCLELTGPVRPAMLREAWRTAVRRHPILRTSFHYERLDTPVQVTRRAVDVAWRELDWRASTDDERAGRLDDLVRADRREPFTLTAAPLMRLTFVRAGADRSWLIWTYHHLLLDGWSMYLVLDDVSRCYRNLLSGAAPTPPPRPFWEYIAWLQRRNPAEAERYWRARLAGVTRPTPLGYEQCGPDVPPDAEFAEVVEFLSPATEAGLTEVARRQRLTPATLVQAAWAVTIGRYAGVDDVVFGSIVSGRPPTFAGIDEMVGLFINVLPVRVRLAAGRPLLDWLSEVQRYLADSRQYEEVPLADIQRWAEVPRGTPLFESLAVFINYPVRESWTDGGDIRVSGQKVLQQPHYPLHLTVVTGADGWRLTLGYDPRRFRRSTVERLVGLLVSVFDAFAARLGAADPTATLDDLPQWTVVTPLPALVAADPQASGPPDVRWADLLRAVAAQRPGATAVTDGRRSLSFRDLAADVDAHPATVDTGTVDGLLAAVAHAMNGTLRVGEVALTPSALTELSWWWQRNLPLDSGDRVFVGASVDALAAVRTRLVALAAGATVVLGAGPGVPDGVTTATVTPAEAHALAGATTGGPGRVVVCPGPLPPTTYEELTRRDDLLLFEEYPVEGPGAQSTLVSPRWPAPRTSPPVGRRATGPRTFPPSGAPPSDVDGPGWTVAAVLAGHPAVRDAYVRVEPAPDGDVWAAYVALRTGLVGPTTAELGELVAARLGRDLVPQRFTVVEGLPENADGDVDPTALPTAGASAATARTRPDDPLVDLVRGLFAGVLDVPTHELGPDTNFFDLGGHSLMAIRLVSRVRSILGVEFTLNDLFAEPTVAGCARAVRTASGGPAPERPEPIRREPVDGPVPMSFGQERLWYLDRLTGEANNVLLPSRLRQPVDAERLRAALRAVADRQQVLRTLLVEHDGVPVQVVSAEADPPLLVDDLSTLPPDVAERQARALLEEDLVRRFDLAAEPPARARLVRLAPDDHVLGVTVHHAAFDGWSTGVLFEELTAAYRGEPGDPPPVQYTDYARWQRERLSGPRLDTLLEYWRARLVGAPDTLDLMPAPGDRVAAGTGATEDVVLPPDLTTALGRFVTAENSTPFMVLLAAYAVLLCRRLPRADVVVAVPVAGRDHSDLTGLVGFFVNTLAVRVTAEDNPTYRDLVRRVRDSSLGALAHAELPFERLVTELRPDRVADRLPLAQVGFNMQNAPFTPLEFDGREAAYFPVRQAVVRYELDLEIHPDQGGLRCRFHHALNRYPTPFVARLAAEFVDLVGRLLGDPDAPVVGPADPPADDDAALADLSSGLLRAAAARTVVGQP